MPQAAGLRPILFDFLPPRDIMPSWNIKRCRTTKRKTAKNGKTDVQKTPDFASEKRDKN
jgi:hypothetical protein